MMPAGLKTAPNGSKNGPGTSRKPRPKMPSTMAAMSRKVASVMVGSP
jgi:hypothetical protein